MTQSEILDVLEGLAAGGNHAAEEWLVTLHNSHGRLLGMLFEDAEKWLESN